MASITPIKGKKNTSYKITVSMGRDLNGNQIRPTMTWTPEPGMTKRQIEKEVNCIACEFEREIKLGFQADDRQTFAEYAEYVLKLKEQSGKKVRTLERYKELLQRINPAIGHLKLKDIRPQHLNAFYQNLGEAGITSKGDKATISIDLPALMKERQLSRAKLAAEAGVSASTITSVCKGKTIAPATADAIAGALGERTTRIFDVEQGNGKLANKTILEYHRLISTILRQAEKEMLVPYNAAAKATPPQNTKKKEVNYFQAEDIANILEALEQEPLEWQMLVHLLIITGCRRGEILGLRWNMVDFDNSQIKIKTQILQSRKLGVYEEDSTKTVSSERYIKLPTETMDLLRKYQKWYEDLRMINGDRWQGTGFLFVTDDGRPRRPDVVTNWLRKFSERHGLSHINPHAFRHTMASLLIHGGKDIVAVSKRLGHSKVSTTTDIYSHIIKEADAESSECLADIILRPKK